MSEEKAIEIYERAKGLDIDHQALAELADQPVCDTCGGTHYLDKDDNPVAINTNSPGWKYCPDCKQPVGTSDAVKILEKRYGTSVAQIAIEQESRIAELETDLEKYGQHGKLCPRRYGDELNPCLCGFDQARKGKGE